MPDTLPCRTLSVSVDCDPQTVYAFLAAPTNFPRWASGLCFSIEAMGEDWLAQTPHGPMHVRFTPQNEFGVVDHYVLPEEGPVIYVPMRVIANGSGSEVCLTLFRQPDMSDEKFANDATWVERDLQSLKRMLEQAAEQ
jgi:hypothetical protein